jgi:hypothetical protein
MVQQCPCGRIDSFIGWLDAVLKAAALDAGLRLELKPNLGMAVTPTGLNYQRLAGRRHLNLETAYVFKLQSDQLLIRTWSSGSCIITAPRSVRLTLCR